MSSKTQMLFSCTLRQEKPVWRIGPPLAWACSRLEVMSLPIRKTRTLGPMTLPSGSYPSVFSLVALRLDVGADAWGPRSRNLCTYIHIHDEWWLFPELTVSKKKAHYLWPNLHPSLKFKMVCEKFCVTMDAVWFQRKYLRFENRTNTLTDLSNYVQDTFSAF